MRGTWLNPGKVDNLELNNVKGHGKRQMVKNFAGQTLLRNWIDMRLVCAYTRDTGHSLLVVHS